MEIILCSGSPRRKSLLESIGIKFTVYKPNVDESREDNEPPEKYTMRLARSKCEEGMRKYPDDVIISADTIVVIDREILGKPSDREDALRMLRKLSGRVHEVITAVAICVSGKIIVKAVHTLVKFRALSEREISAYVETGECDDKAGAYAVQGLGSLMIEGINGDYYNVVGLPLCTLGEMMRAEGLNLLKV